MPELTAIVRAIRRCRVCVTAPRGQPLPHEPRPVLRASATARLAICGQAPGTRVHRSGRPFSDPSGDRLRSWLNMPADLFYDEARVAIVPMGFCFPGHDAKGGDLPPRRECAAQWHRDLFAAMPQVELVLAVGAYAQAFHLGAARGKTLQETMLNWRAHLEAPRSPRVFPLPHPSWRNNAWLKKNPWFEVELLPALRREVGKVL
ncbi:uracil-DNA glycosylase [Methyloceanibacter methanicus]|uniref:Uracil-DNA glycosylase n=1 Tax=Methyloceanibacter methanicus TaxID=1774968 RepID=A0A1E3VYW3_9HYPH|nr:uracil-DNA glycosylase family protein [Methyloceanibacter methanicus]ODR98461.1 uracil-DNA glycosylase [Methyloceanibacter methanicus]